jgi:hypothetical protein
VTYIIAHRNRHSIDPSRVYTETFHDREEAWARFMQLGASPAFIGVRFRVVQS